MISDSGSPCLSDFGLSKVLKLEGMTATSSEVGGSLRWMSPELFHDNLHSTKSDVWAYAMTVLASSVWKYFIKRLICFVCVCVCRRS